MPSSSRASIPIDHTSPKFFLFLGDMPETYSYKVLADDEAAAHLEEPAIPSWSSLSFGITLHVRNVMKNIDERGVRRMVYVDPPFERNLKFQCARLCRDRESFRDDAVSREASKIITSILDTLTGDVVPPATREAIAGAFGRLACRMLRDGRYVRCRKLPTTVVIVVFSTSPMISRLLSRSAEPASESTIRSLERCQLIPSGMPEEETCLICLAEIPARSAVARLPCCHFFHDECIVPWLRINRICPLCRFVLPN